LHCHIRNCDPAPPVAFDLVPGSMLPHITLNFSMARSLIGDGAKNL
jgi:hypothetical protein